MVDKEESSEEEMDLSEIRKRNKKYYKDTGSRMKDYVFNNWILKRYDKNGNLFTFSDHFIWKGAVYVVPQWISYLIFISLFLWLASVGIENYGETRTIIFFMLLIMWRIQSLLSEMHELNEKL